MLGSMSKVSDRYIRGVYTREEIGQILYLVTSRVKSLYSDDTEQGKACLDDLNEVEVSLYEEFEILD